MKYFETLDYNLSIGFKNSEAKSLLAYQLDKEPYSYIKNIPFREYSYDANYQGVKYSYQVDEETGTLTVVLDVEHDYKKRNITFEVKRRGNEVNILTRTPREDTKFFHVRHNADHTVSLLSRRIKFYGRDDEEVLESRYALLSPKGSMIDYSEDIVSSEVLRGRKKYKYK